MIVRSLTVGLFVWVLAANLSASAQLGDHYLNDLYGEEERANLAAQASNIDYYPRCSDRTFWESIPNEFGQDLVAKGETFLDYVPEHLKSSDFRRISETGDRVTYQRKQRKRRNGMIYMTLAECVEYEGRFTHAIADLAWMISEETWWGSPAHIIGRQSEVLPDTRNLVADLFVGDTAKDLALVYYFLDERLDAYSPVIKTRIHIEVSKRFLERMPRKLAEFQSDVDNGKRINNWGAWLGKNWVACAFLLDLPPEARADELKGAFQTLDLYLRGIPEDGSVDEGPGYWTAGMGRLYTVLKWLEHYSPEIDPIAEPQMRVPFEFIDKIYLGDGYFTSNSDTTARYPSSPYLLSDIAVRLDSPRLARLAREFLPDQVGFETAGLQGGSGFDIFRTLSYELFSRDKVGPALELAKRSDGTPELDAWLADLEMFVARSNSDRSSFTVTAKGGHNDESHNHNDIGVVAVYYDQSPVIVDPGKQLYRLSNFNEDRYVEENWYHLSPFHNLPSFGGVPQKEGAQYRSKDVSVHFERDKAKFSAELAGGYPSSANLTNFKRRVKLQRGTRVTVKDKFKMSRAQDVEIGFMTPTNIELHPTTSDLILIQPSGQRIAVGYDAAMLDVRVEPLDLTDQQMLASWGQLSRVVFSTKSPVEAGDWTFSFEAAE